MKALKYNKDLVHLSGIKLLAREFIPWRAMILVQYLKLLISNLR